MRGIASLGYAVFGVSDFDAWQHFATEVIGLQLGARSDAHIDLRMDELHMRLQLESSSDDDLLAAGWCFDTDDDLREFVEQRRAAGIEVVDLGPEVAARRHVEAAFAIDDPNGFRHELVAGCAAAPLATPFRSRAINSSFVTGPLGFGHLLPSCRDYPASIAFYRNVLGLLVSDRIRQEVAPGRVVDATFFHTRTGRHHSLATGQLPGSKRLNHLMVQVADLDDVGLALDRCKAAQLPIVMELGHHPNDRMTSFYVRTPSGFALELGWGGIVIDDASWEVRTYSQLSDWGHASGRRA